LVHISFYFIVIILMYWLKHMYCTGEASVYVSNKTGVELNDEKT